MTDKWEYRCERDEMSTLDLNTLGAQGWELVSVEVIPSGMRADKRRYYFKRRKP